MENYQLNAEKRSELGKSINKKLRNNKKVPAILYGRKTDSLNITVVEQDIEKALAYGANLIELKTDGTSKTVIVKDVQKEPVKGNILHVDFYEVSLDRAIETEVSIVLVGEEARESDGGIVNLVIRELSISCLPMAIPDNIEIDISGLQIGDSVYVSDLNVPEGVEVLDESDDVVVNISQPEAEIEEPEEEDEEAEEGVEAAEEGEDTEETEES